MSPAPGSRNALTDIPGILVGTAEDRAARTGVTVAVFDTAMRCAADIRGGGPATRETQAVTPEGTVGLAHALVLSGGSVFGLAAADRVAARLSANGTGLSIRPGAPPVPLVPAASLYDLGNGGDKDWGDEPPYRGLGAQALAAASTDLACGSVGAGYGAVAGRWLGGQGTASLDLGEHGLVAALVAVNAIGSPVMPDGSCFWAWPFEIAGEFGGARPGPGTEAGDPIPADCKLGIAAGEATSIGIVACSRPLDRQSLQRVAIMAQDGLARAIRPSHAPFDGDTLFAICPTEDPESNADAVTRIGSAAADCVARAVARGVWEADAETDTARGYQQAFVSGTQTV